MTGVIFGHLKGKELVADEIPILKHSLIAGIILFERNYEDPYQLQELVKGIKFYNNQLIIGVDHEGGRVQRFRRGFTQIPAMRALSGITSQFPDQCEKLLYAVGWLLAAELKEVSLDLNFGPVLDLDTHTSTIIGERSFSQNPETVASMACSVIRGMKAAGMHAIGKHFPGHGGVKEDSHITLPVDHRTLEELKQQDLAPFIALKNDLAGIMSAHIHYPKVDDEVVTFSSKWQVDILRKSLHYQGVLLSDDLMMAGALIEPDPIQRVLKSWQAGADVALWCNGFDELRAVLDALEGIEPEPYIKRKVAALKAFEPSAPLKDNFSRDHFKEHAQSLVELMHGNLVEQARVVELAEYF
jgi:beta-N-acetylhexosaminidase